MCQRDWLNKGDSQRHCRLWKHRGGCLRHACGKRVLSEWTLEMITSDMEEDEELAMCSSHDAEFSRFSCVRLFVTPWTV